MSGLVSTDGKPLEKKEDVKFIGLRITPVGEMQVWQKGEDRYSIEPEAVPLFSSLQSPSIEILDSMGVLFGCIGEVLKMSDRAIPVTRKELQNNGISKKVVKKLSRTGLVRNVSIATTKMEKGKVVAGPSVNVVYPTPQGKAFFKEFFNEENNDSNKKKESIPHNNFSDVRDLPANSSPPEQDSTSSRNGELNNESFPKIDYSGSEEAE